MEDSNSYDSPTPMETEGEDVYVFPTSFAQQRLWFIDQLEGESSAFNRPMALRFTGALDTAALEQSFNEIIRRHEILRTTFALVDDEPVQLIASPMALRLTVKDLSARPLAEREREARRLAKEEAQRPFNLALGPLLRAQLLRLAEGEHILLLTMHHIISDGWSDGVMRHEMTTLYDAYVMGEPSPLPELQIQYADYAVWQREYLQGEVLEAGLGYWRQQLAGAPLTLNLATDRARPAVQSLDGAMMSFMLPADVSESLRVLSREEGVSLYMTLLAAFQTLLHRYTGQEDIVVGSSISGRTRPEIEALIGCFVNMLVMRTDLSGDPTFRELLARVREVALGAFVHQEIPFEKLVDELQPRRDMSRAPLFQVLLVLQNIPQEDSKPSSLSLSPLSNETATAKLDLSLELRDNGKIVGGTVEYSTALFDETSVRRIVEHYRILIEAIVANPARRLSELPLLTEAERQQLLDQERATRQSYPRDASIQELFEAQAERSPEAIAALFKDEQVSYGELNRRANQLAHYLRSLGVGPEVLVGICMERSVEMLVGLLGILKAGGAYVPLDPEYPQERLALMLEDAAVPVLVAHERLAEELPVQWAQVVCLDSEWEAIANESVENPPHEVSAAHLAYVMYTSGSTGRPKGVSVTHRGVVRLVSSPDYAALTPAEVLLQFAPLSFDASTFEIWGALLNGGRLAVMPPERPSLDELGQAIVGYGVTTLWLTAVIFQQMVESQLESLRGLGQLLAGGDVLPLAQVDKALGELARTKLINGYGPTENTTFTCCYVMQGQRAGTTSAPIGKPIANTQVYVLDAEFKQVGVGVAGELYAGGDGLARDYLHRPDLTAERFIPHPFSESGGERLYRTGDLVRYLPDGNIEFLGRLDAQVKVRGYRIELGEVEAALAAHPEVSEAAVATVEDEAGADKRLVAYVVAARQKEPTTTGLRNFLKERLPEYMIPSAFVVLDELPLTPSGKLDRRALPAPDDERPALDKEFTPPVTPLQEMLAGLWSQVLGIERVGIHDDFFELGGDSIRGAIFINKLQEVLGEIVQVVLIFNLPTIAGLAEHLEERYAQSVAKLLGTSAGNERAKSILTKRLDEATVARARKLIPPLPAREGNAPKNPPAIFILSPPRCGSTLLRVMMAGNPRLFAPPELDLLAFDTLSQRKNESAGRDTFWSEGMIRALMELKGCDAEQAKQMVADFESQDMTVQQCYRLMQDLIGDRLLVDKTPTYALNPDVLRRAEADFENPLFIHLIRHPYGMIRSFEEARVDHLLVGHKSPLPVPQLAELVWLISNENIREFLREVPERRQHEVRFEDLVTRPREVMEKLCEFLGIDFHPGMIEPYKDKKKLMTDGIHAESRMIGDAKFHQHKNISAQSAERWRGYYADDFLGDATWQLASVLGYERSTVDGAASSSSNELTAIKRVPRDGETPLPLSFAQQRLWFIDQMEPGNSFYNLPIAMRLKGELNIQALEQTLNEVIRRHEVLRTSFATVDGSPVQVIAPSLALQMTVVDLRSLPKAELEAEVRRLTSEEADRPFDLSQGPLLRAGLLRISEEEHVVLFTMHHIISDGWSKGVLVEEVRRLYEAFSGGQPSPLPELPIQYADYAVWQREWLQGDALNSQLVYWKQQLAAAPATLDLPTDHPRPAVQTFRGAQQSLSLSREVSEGLKRLSQEEGATLFMTLLAAFQTLLYRYTGQEDLLVGTPIAGRTRAEVEGLIGFFVNTLVLRGEVKGGVRFREVVRRAREVCLGAYAHQEVPFEKLVEELQPERDLSRHPLFQVAFHLLNTIVEPLALPGLRLFPMEMDHNTAKFDITLTLEEISTGLLATLNYNTDLFEKESIERTLQHFQTLLEGVINNPDQRLSQLPLLTEAERHQLLSEWNDTRAPFPSESCIHQLFEAQAERMPEAVALDYDDEQMSYAELNARANQLAHHLRSLGVDRESLVGILLERSPKMVVCLLGVLKAGAAYVPLDPSYPVQRLSFMVEDAGLRLLLTDKRLRGNLSECPTPVLDLDRDQHLIAQQSVENPRIEVGASNLAYVIYTSGSTGRPKGIAIPHRGVTRLVCNTDYVHLQASDRIAQAANVSFDAATFEVWGALLHGARVVGISYEATLSPSALAAQLRRQQINVMFLTTALFNQLMREEPTALSGVRDLLFGGEAVDPRWVRAALKEGRPQRLLHVYGPTESTTFATWEEVEEVDDEAHTIAIGRPVANTRAYVLDADLEPVPVGVPGELYLGGDGLARGYLNRAELTAERFAPDSYSGEYGARLYRTGDTVRYAEGGKIEFIGRVDEQVKLRGNRIELGEIEATLREHPSVAEAVVIASTEEDGAEKRLVAYLVGGAETQPTTSELRSYLRERLPEYMIPSAFVMLESLPLTPNGKVDRRALPAPELSRAEMVGEYVAPRNATEEMLAGIWAEVLKAERISVYDNFFEIGGHSLLATQVMSRVNSRFHTKLPLHIFFESPTVVSLAMAIERRQEADQDKTEQPEIQRVARGAGNMERLLAELDQLSESEVKALLADQK